MSPGQNHRSNIALFEELEADDENRKEVRKFLKAWHDYSHYSALRQLRDSAAKAPAPSQLLIGSGTAYSGWLEAFIIPTPFAYFVLDLRLNFDPIDGVNHKLSFSAAVQGPMCPLALSRGDFKLY